MDLAASVQAVTCILSRNAPMVFLHAALHCAARGTLRQPYSCRHFMRPTPGVLLGEWPSAPGITASGTTRLHPSLPLSAGCARRFPRRGAASFNNHEDVPATNNHDERLLRHAVCMRKVSFGTQSPEGSRLIERILTTVTTLRLQERPIFAFLTQAVEARLRGERPPSLLPSPAPVLQTSV